MIVEAFPWLVGFSELTQTPLGLGLVLVAALLLGLIVGSFLNVVIHRLPQIMHRQWGEECKEFMALQATPSNDQSAPAPDTTPDAPPAPEKLTLSYPPSRCPHCHTPIRYRDNIPVLSYLLLRGKCRQCHTPISWRYPLVEALSGLLSMAVAYHMGWHWITLASLLFLWVLIALTFIDLDWQLLPDQLTLPLLWGGLLVNLLGGITSLSSAVIGAMAGYLLLWSVYWGFKLLTGKEGMGYGDFKLLAALGAWMGWQPLPLVLLVAASVGATVGIILMAFFSHQRQKPLPFGPYLALGGLACLFWRSEMVLLLS